MVVPEQAQHLLGLALAEQAVVDENAGEAGAYGQVHQHGGNGGVDAAGQGADDPLVRPHPFPQRRGGGLDEGAHGPHTL